MTFWTLLDGWWASSLFFRPICIFLYKCLVGGRPPPTVLVVLAHSLPGLVALTASATEVRPSSSMRARMHGEERQVGLVSPTIAGVLRKAGQRATTEEDQRLV